MIRTIWFGLSWKITFSCRPPMVVPIIWNRSVYDLFRRTSKSEKKHSTASSNVTRCAASLSASKSYSKSAGLNRRQFTMGDCSLSVPIEQETIRQNSNATGSRVLLLRSTGIQRNRPLHPGLPVPGTLRLALHASRTTLHHAMVPDIVFFPRSIRVCEVGSIGQRGFSGTRKANKVSRIRAISAHQKMRFRGSPHRGHRPAHSGCCRGGS